MKGRRGHGEDMVARRSARACLLAVAAVCSLWFAAGAGGAGQGPRISVDEPMYDFGSVAAGTVLEHVFEIRNTGDGVLSIGKIEPS